MHPSRALTGLTALLWVAGVAALGTWFQSTGARFDMSDWRVWMMAAAEAAAAVGVVSFWKSSERGQLVWDGELWHEGLATPPRDGWWSNDRLSAHASTSNDLQVQVVIDAQRAMLLRLTRGQQASRWVWVERNAQPERWLDLRRAVHSPGRRPQRHDDDTWDVSTPEATSQ